MIVKLAKKQPYRKCIVVIVCLFVAGNLLHGTVLCLGADGRIELESAFHQRCNDSVHSDASNEYQPAHESDQDKGEHCEPCVDIPISIGVAKISSTPKQLNPAFLVPAAIVVEATDTLSLFAYNSASNTFADTPYFSPLRTVILLL